MWEDALEEALQTMREIPARHVIKAIEFTFVEHRVNTTIQVFYHIDNQGPREPVSEGDLVSVHRTRSIFAIEQWYQARSQYDLRPAV